MKVKFRAWDKRNQEMVYDVGVMDGKFYRIIQEHKVYGHGDSGSVRNLDVGYYGMNSNNLVGMQFTGMFDKHGNEIYRDDLLRVTTPEYFIQEAEVIMRVSHMENGCWMYKVKEVIKWEGYNVPEPVIGGTNSCINYTLSNVEVIGNIYEGVNKTNES